MMIHAVSATVQLLHGPRRRQEAGKRGAHGIGVGIGIGIGIGIQSRCSDPCDCEPLQQCVAGRRRSGIGGCGQCVTHMSIEGRYVKSEY